jgi:hypothetical protein
MMIEACVGREGEVVRINVAATADMNMSLRKLRLLRCCRGPETLNGRRTELRTRNMNFRVAMAITACRIAVWRRRARWGDIACGRRRRHRDRGGRGRHGRRRYTVPHRSRDLIGVLSTYPSRLRLLFCCLQLFHGDAATEPREFLLASKLEVLPSELRSSGRWASSGIVNNESAAWS